MKRIFAWIGVIFLALSTAAAFQSGVIPVLAFLVATVIAAVWFLNAFGFHLPMADTVRGRWVYGSMLALLIIVGVSSMGGGREKEQQVAKPPSTATITPTATATPRATATPTATPKPQMPPEYGAYALYMLPKYEGSGTAMGRFSELLGQAGDNPSLLLNADWKAQVATVLATLRLYGGQIQKYEPVPPGLKAVDDLTVSMGKDLVYIADQFGRFLDTLNSTYLDNSVQRMPVAMAKAEQILKLINEVTQRYR